MILKFTFANSWPIIAVISFIIVVCLYIKGKEDAKTFDADLRGLITRFRNCPVNPESFKTFRSEFRELGKSRFARRNYESLSVAWSEFKCKFKEYFK